MLYFSLQAAAAVYLTTIAFLLRTGTAFDALLLKLVPAAIGITLAFFSLADAMGWPV